MQEFIRKNKSSIILIIIVVAIISFFLIRNHILNSNYNKNRILEYDMVPKTYGVNEYVSVNISDKDMADIYFNDYISTVYTDIEKSYMLLNEEYRNKKFNNLEEYKNFINNLSVGKIEKYYTQGKNNSKIYAIYDSNNNFYAFETKGVMQYSVYLDDYTIDILK